MTALHSYDGGDLIANLQLAILHQFDPSASVHGEGICRGRERFDIPTPRAYRSQRRRGALIEKREG
ncbi:MAG: hypothetical protein AAGF12_28930 [Myxococcota bacterium]